MTSPLDGLVTSLRSSTSFLAGNYQIPLSLVHAYGEMYGLTSKLVRTCQTLQYISPHPLVYIALMQLSTPLLVTLAIAYFGQILESPISSFPALALFLYNSHAPPEHLYVRTRWYSFMQGPDSWTPRSRLGNASPLCKLGCKRLETPHHLFVVLS